MLNKDYDLVAAIQDGIPEEFHNPDAHYLTLSKKKTFFLLFSVHFFIHHPAHN